MGGDVGPLHLFRMRVNREGQREEEYMKGIHKTLLVSMVVCLLGLPSLGIAETRLVLKSARQASTYYAFAVGQANAIMAGARDVGVTVEDSPGSMVNVKESRTRKNFLFTSPPILIASALGAKGKFKEGGYEKIRSLWPIPGIVMHWVVREDSGVKTLRDLVGKRFIPGGAGSAGARFTIQVLGAIGIKDKVELPAVDLSEGVQAVKNRRAVGFSTASSAPAGLVSEIAATTPIRLLELEDADYQKVSRKFARYIIPAGTYKGVDYDVKTMSLLVGTYTTADLPDEVAYGITKAFWENRNVWEKSHPAMKLVKMEGLNQLVAKVHPGALRYYEQIGFRVSDVLK
jgi:TRAP transporter TAXI family solute receptor